MVNQDPKYVKNHLFPDIETDQEQSDLEIALESLYGKNSNTNTQEAKKNTP